MCELCVDVYPIWLLSLAQLVVRLQRFPHHMANYLQEESMIGLMMHLMVGEGTNYYYWFDLRLNYLLKVLIELTMTNYANFYYYHDGSMFVCLI